MSRIPKRFHFVFGLRPQKEPFHLAHYLCLESCLQVNQPEEISFYYHYEPFGPYWRAIKDRLDLVRVDLVDFVSEYRYPLPFFNQFRYAHHSDFIRLEILAARGGIYADIDTVFVHPIPGELYDEPFVLGQEPDVIVAGGAPTPSLCNAFIMSEPGAEFGALWLAGLQPAFDGTWSNHSTLLPYRLSQTHPHLIHVAPRPAFYKHGCTPHELWTLLEGCDADYSGVVSMHLWSHLWWSQRRVDFSTFHAGRLTEEYVRTVDTTYNLVARRFLPAQLHRRWWGLRALVR